jgi:hypothetical protein
LWGERRTVFYAEFLEETDLVRAVFPCGGCEAFGLLAAELSEDVDGFDEDGFEVLFAEV